jgi:predicted transcriptional regulator
MAEKKKASTRKPAAKLSVLGVRLEPAIRAALDKCAAADERPISVMAHKIIADYLRGNGWLK